MAALRFRQNPAVSGRSASEAGQARRVDASAHDDQMKHMANFVPNALLPTLRRAKRRARAAVTKLDARRMSESAFQDLLIDLGIRPGATVMVHSSMDSIARRVPTMTPLSLIEVLQNMLGEEGTLLMPTFPFGDLQVRYARENPEFDSRRTPSRVGLVTEIFRRSRGVRRSLHPTHPVAAWGKHADALLDTHHLGTAFGTLSPLCKLKVFDGSVVGLGASPASFTLLHVAEELHPKTYAYHYDTTPIPMTITNGTETIPYDLYALRGDRTRDYTRAIRTLKKEGILRQEIRHGLSVCATRANAFIERAMKLIDEGNYSI